MELSSIQASLWNISWSSGFILFSSTILFGAGIGSAFCLFMANRSKEVPSIYFATRTVVIADFLFTSPAAVVQLLTGLWLLRLTGYSLSDSWVKWGLALYFFAGACWLPVVWMQVEMRDMARAALETEKPLPERYWRRDRWWTVLGSLAFPAIVIVFYLMVAKP
jgi:uncharacterized membrane protein